MKALISTFFLIIMSLPAYAEDGSVDLTTFAKRYFDAFVAAQSPEANEAALQNYLNLLKENIAHTHLPWQTDDSRRPDGKKLMQEGMTYYLGSHSEYQAELLDLFTFNDTAIAIRYKHSAKGIHPQNKQQIEYTEIIMEVLEMEDGKVSVIRKYHQ